MTDLPQDSHAMELRVLLEYLQVDPRHGLNEAEVTARREQFGRNQLAEAEPVPLWKKFVRQFRELVIWILIVAAVISGVLGDWVETAAILAIVLMNGMIGFLQEERAERALSSLQKLFSPTTKVLRNGSLQVLPAAELVPGDAISLEAGDYIPADARLVEAFGFRVQEAALTGESVPVDKDPRAKLDQATSLGDRSNMVFLGTIVATGKASAVAVATGMTTELGKIAGFLHEETRELTPLQRRLAELGKTLVVVCLVVVVIIFGLHLYRGGRLLDVFLVSVGLAVAAVPEGLPAVVTMLLALGLQRMVKRNALVRRLPSVETLGSVTVICSDKTGTLTRNEMTVREVFAGETSYQVTGTGYVPQGEFQKAGTRVDPKSEPDLLRVLSIGCYCNDATVSQTEGDTWRVIGDPTEGALIVTALKAGIDSKKSAGELVSEIPFDSDRKAMSVILRGADGRLSIYTKGAPEVVLSKSTQEYVNGKVRALTDVRRAEIRKANSAMADRALRVLALAFSDDPSEKDGTYEESNLVFGGLMGMIDPPREEVKDAVRKCHTAGIRAVMITGDHPATARAIARELRIDEGNDGTLSGDELTALSDEALIEQVEQVSVYARVSAEHKLRVVNAWKKRGQVVAMTGDGVNDAPAVKAADIGIAMGIAGTDVTKEASDMVLTDDNFASIVNAVEEGRGIFNNIQKVVHYLLSCNAGEVLFMFFAAVVGWPVPLTAIQLLWINLATDGLPAIALGMERPEADIMSRPPRPPHEPVITLRRGLLILTHGTLMATVTAIGFWLVYKGDKDDHENIVLAQTVAFGIMAFVQLFFSIGCRSDRSTMPELGAFSNPHLFGAIALSCLMQLGVMTIPAAQTVFDAGATLRWEWAVVIGLALVPVTLIETTKIIVSLKK